MKRLAYLIGVILVLLLVFKQPHIVLTEKGKIIAYQGLNQPTDYSNLEQSDCTATRVKRKQHNFIENTLPAFDEALRLGADTLHFNIHHTLDNQFVVFHDWTLDCRTNGAGVTSEQSYDYLRTLDVGYGYQIQGTNEYPLRGTGIGLMPTLATVLDRYPQTRLLINMKTNQPLAVKNLIDILDALDDPQRSRLSFIGTDEVIKPIQQALPGIRVFSKSIAKSCLIKYAIYGWTRFFPDSCRSMDIIVPAKYAGLLWGWPDQLAARSQQNDSRVYLYLTQELYSQELNYIDRGIGLFTGDLVGIKNSHAE